MKSIKSLRNPSTKNFAKTLEEITISEETIAEEEGDQVSSVLLALNHLASIADDLYTVVGDEDIRLDEDEMIGILNAYDVISEIFDKYEGMVAMPSREYDLDELDVEVMEEIEEEYSALQEALTEAVARTPLEQKELDVLKKLGFATAPVGRDTWLPSEKVTHMWGIPMRAGKFADVFFAVFDDKESKKFAIADSEGVTKFTELEKAMTALKKRAKMVESVELEETPDRFGSSKAKIKAAIDGFKNKLDSGKYPDSESDFKKIIANLEKQYGKIDEAGIPPYAPSKSMRNPRGSVDDALKELDKMIAEYKKRISTEKNASVIKELKRILAGLEEQKDIFMKVIYPTLTDKEKKQVQEAVNKAELNARLKEVTSRIKFLNAAFSGTHKDPHTLDELGKLNKEKEALLKSLKEDVDLSEAQKIVTWPLSDKGINDPFRMEVVGQAGSAVAKILDKVLPSSKFNLYGNDIGFKSVGEREAAGAALVKYFKTIKEQDCTEFDLGILAEEFDEAKFRRLAMTGLVPDGDVAKVVMAMKRLNAGKELAKDQKDLITSTFVSLIGLVTGDTSVFTKIQQKLKAE